MEPWESTRVLVRASGTNPAKGMRGERPRLTACGAVGRLSTREETHARQNQGWI